MDTERLAEKERYDMLAEMADLYYNQGKTQSEIAKYFDTNRFRVAKLLQDARNEQIVEIKINYANERNKALEAELKENLPLDKAIVVNTQYAPYIDSQIQLGKAGADYLQRLLKPESVIGIAWGKTLYSVISQLPSVVHNPVTAVQITGYMKMMNPSIDTRELVRAVATAFNGNYYYIDLPIYLKNSALWNELRKEPVMKKTLEMTKHMDVILSGIGGKSSLPVNNPQLQDYLSQKDRDTAEQCLGSLYGYVLDNEGQIADLDINKQLVGADKEDILKTPHRIVVACGRHKTECITKALQHGLFNELITDSDTAIHLVEKYRER